MGFLMAIPDAEIERPALIERESYRVVCLRVGCGWEKKCASPMGARSRALVHETMNAGHRTWMYYTVHDISMGCARKRRAK